MRRAYLVTDVLTVTESKQPDRVAVSINGITTELTEEQFKELCDLRYKIDFIPTKENNNE